MVLILLRWARLAALGVWLSVRVWKVEKAGNVSASVRTNQRKIGRTHPRDLKKNGQNQPSVHHPSCLPFTIYKISGLPLYV
jgi:hypothetical protein